MLEYLNRNPGAGALIAVAIVAALLLIVGRHPLYSMSPKEWLR